MLEAGQGVLDPVVFPAAGFALWDSEPCALCGIGCRTCFPSRSRASRYRSTALPQSEGPAYPERAIGHIPFSADWPRQIAFRSTAINPAVAMKHGKRRLGFRHLFVAQPTEIAPVSALVYATEIQAARPRSRRPGPSVRRLYYAARVRDLG